MNNLCCQAYNVIHSNLLTDIELAEIKQYPRQQLDASMSTTELATSVSTDESLSDSVPLLQGNINSPDKLADDLDVNDKFKSLCLIVDQCLLSDDVTPELKTVFDQFCVCLLEVGTLEIDIRQALPRVVETQAARHW